MSSGIICLISEASASAPLNFPLVQATIDRLWKRGDKYDLDQRNLLFSESVSLNVPGQGLVVGSAIKVVPRAIPLDHSYCGNPFNLRPYPGRFPV
jgi:hypothetical protein